MKVREKNHRRTGLSDGEWASEDSGLQLASQW